MQKEEIYPLLGEDTIREWVTLDLSISNKLLYPDQGDFSFQRLSDFIDENLDGNLIGYGGYMERRGMYLNKDLFGGNRHIHLGIDVWSEEGTIIYAAADGIVHSVANNDNYLDFGNTIIVKYELSTGPINCLYGHLSSSSIINKRPGMHISRGTPLAEIGNETENGGWKPHLHLQLIHDLGSHDGDFPGVSSVDDLEAFKLNCPDPSFLLVYDNSKTPLLR